MKRAQKGEGFPGQRIVVLPRLVVAHAQKQPLASGLMPTDAGYFPRAAGHLRERNEGINQAIFIYCVRGSGWCELAGERHSVHAGKVLVIPPGAPHAYGADDKKPWTIHWFHAQGSSLGDFLAELDVSAARPVVFLGDDPQVLAIIGEVLDVLEQGYTPQQMLHASQALRHLLAVMIRHRNENGRAQPDSRQKINRTLAYMKEHLDRPLQLDTLAALANLSRSRYAALFKEQTGFAPIDYFNRLRMHRACQWLDTTEWSVKSIASRLGYDDPLYFSRVFRSVTERSPMAYRRLHKG
ncbi:MAG: AraC family transcriptional regulator [Verrucomicrobiae bacterium]|nr:AraC family transcriptional regulator [Verrucomicrobiae bacterium]